MDTPTTIDRRLKRRPSPRPSASPAPSYARRPNDGVLPYVKFHAMFERTVPLTERYRVLEAAVRTLADVSAVDYGVLLACDNGLPGPDFFQRFRRNRMRRICGGGRIVAVAERDHEAEAPHCGGGTRSRLRARAPIDRGRPTRRKRVRVKANRTMR